MAIEVSCECGRTLKVKDEYAGRQVRCPGCGDVLLVPGGEDEFDEGLQDDFGEAESFPAPMPSRSSSGSRSTMSVSGKPIAAGFGNIMVPSMFGSTTLELRGDRLIEHTQRIVARRDGELLLSEVESAEILVTGNPVLIALGIPTIALFGLGLILIICYFIFKYRFLVIHTGGNAVGVSIKGDEGPYQDFMRAVLDAAVAEKPK